VKYFICAFGNNLLGIPAEHTQRVIPVTRVQECVFIADNEEAFISIPALFQKKDAARVQETPHGLVLKDSFRINNWPGKIILLSPKIDIDLEIPEEKIRKLPEVFAGVFAFFRGACFQEDSGKMILILDLEKLLSKQQWKGQND